MTADAMDTSLVAKSQTAWEAVLHHVQGAVVFIDSKAGECLHWSIGVESLLLHGASAIRELHAYKYSQNPVDDADRAVFISACAYSSIQVDLCDIISQSSFHTVVLLTLPVHDPSSSIPRLKNELLQWMSIRQGTSKVIRAEVVCFPFFFAPITENVVMLSPFCDIFPPLDLDKVKSFGSRTDTLSLKDQASAENLAMYLDSLLGQISAADVVFSVGTLSGAVASALEDLPSVHHRRKMAQHRISVVIVDRCLDLCSAASVDSKCFLDKLLCALPHLPGHTNDVAVNMSQLAQVTVDSVQDEALFPGSLSHPDGVCRNIIEWLISKKDRDILTNLHQILRSKLSPGSEIESRVKPETLEKDVRRFRGNIEKIQQNCGILQIALAVVQTLNGDHAEELDLVLSTERVLRENVASSTDLMELSGLLPQITKLLVERHIRGLNLDSILTLILLLYSLTGSNIHFPLKDEVQLQAAICTALYEDQEFPGIVHDILLPLEAKQEQVDAIATHIFTVIKAVSHARKDLSKYKSLLKTQDQSMSAEYVPILDQIMRDITDPSKPNTPDLSCRTSGLRDLLKSGFSMLLNKQQNAATHHPSDQPNLLLLVLGGISGGEIQSLQKAWINSSQCKGGGELIVASTRLLSPSDTLQIVLKSASQPLR